MKEFLTNMKDKIVEGWKGSSKTKKLKWGFVISAAVLGLFGNLLDTKLKDEAYERQVAKAIAAKVEAEKLGNTTEG